MKKEWISLSPQDTFEIGKTLGQQAQKGEIYCLDGDLGAGKTMLSKGIGAGLGVTEPINSPTFTILQVYTGGRLPLYHFDVYRLGDPSELEELGYEEFFFGDGVCLVEWSELVEDYLPQDAVRIQISKDRTQGDSWRLITVKD